MWLFVLSLLVLASCASDVSFNTKELYCNSFADSDIYSHLKLKTDCISLVSPRGDRLCLIDIDNDDEIIVSTCKKIKLFQT